MKVIFHALLMLLLLAVISPAVAWSDSNETEEGAAAVVIPEIADLREEAELARKKGLPILVMFSSDYCPYCSTVKNDFLKPMMYSGDYERKILFRMLMLRPGQDVIDFDGRKINVYDFADRYKVRVTPTLVFIDARGRQVAQKMVGLTTPDFFGGYLDDAITTAYDHVRNGTTFACKDAQTRSTC